MFKLRIMNVKYDNQIEEHTDSDSSEIDVNDPEFYFQDDLIDYDTSYYDIKINNEKLEVKYKLLISKCKTNNRECFITEQQYIEFMKHNPKCYYCKGLFKCNKTGGYQLDRIDNSKGYHIDNILRCCWECNRLRSNNYSSEEFKFIASYLIKKRGLLGV